MSTVDQAPAKWVGQSLRRKEDPPLITGRAQYVDDISLPGMLWAAIVRSPQAHAKIISIDTSAALQRDGIHAVYTGEDMGDLLAPLPHAWAPPGVEVKTPERWPLARGEVTDEASVRRGLEGNLCRCTGYHGIVQAVLAAAGKGSST